MLRSWGGASTLKVIATSFQLWKRSAPNLLVPTGFCSGGRLRLVGRRVRLVDRRLELGRLGLGLRDQRDTRDLLVATEAHHDHALGRAAEPLDLVDWHPD